MLLLSSLQPLALQVCIACSHFICNAIDTKLELLSGIQEFIIHCLLD